MSRILHPRTGYEVDPETGFVYGPRGVPIGSPDSSGYLQIDGRTRGLGMLPAHVLVWEAVEGRAVPKDLEINHRNGAKVDNRYGNLEAVTHQENVLHSYATGLASNQGERHPGHKLTDASVREIRRRRARGERAEDIARDLGVTGRSVRNVAAGRAWAHVTEEVA